MRYRLLASYQGAPYEAGVGPQETGVVLFAACPPPEDLGFEPATGHWRKRVDRDDVQTLYESRPVGMFRGERCVVLDELNERLHIAYLGHDAYRAEQLGFWEVDRGVFELITPRQEVTEIVEQRRQVATPGEGGSYPQPAPPPLPPASGAPYGYDAGHGNGSRPGRPPQDLLTGPEGLTPGPAPLPLPVPVPVPGEHPLPLEAEAMRAARKAKESESKRDPDHGPVPAAPSVPPVSKPAGISEPSSIMQPGETAASVPSWSPQPQVPPQRQASGSGQITESATGWPSVPESPATARASRAETALSANPPSPSFEPAHAPVPAQPALPGQPAASPGVSLQRPRPADLAGSGQDRIAASNRPEAEDRQAEPGAVASAGSHAQAGPHAHGGPPAQAGSHAQAEQAPYRVPQPPEPLGRVNGAHHSWPASHGGQVGSPPAAGLPRDQFERPRSAAASGLPVPAAPSGAAVPGAAKEPGSGGGVVIADPESAFPYATAAPYGPPLPAAHPGPTAPPAAPAGSAATSPAEAAAEPADLADPADPATPQPASRRRRASRRRLPTQRIFSDLAAQAGIPPGAYAINEDADGAMCLVSTGEGFEVFNSLAGARHEVRVFKDEESAYFYLFGVLAAEAVRTGVLGPTH